MNALVQIGRVMLASCMMTACQWGTVPSKLPLAAGPQGSEVAFRLAGDQGRSFARKGELFTVDSVGVIILVTDSLVRVPWASLGGLDVLRFGRDYDVRAGGAVTPRNRELLALVSRFPHGLSGEQLARALRMYKQDALKELP